MIIENRNRDINFLRSILIFLSHIISKFFSWILIGLSIIILLTQNKQNRLNSYFLEFFNYAITPIEESLFNFTKYISNFNNLLDSYNQNLILKHEVDELKKSLQEFELIKAENNRLKDLLYFIPGKKFHYHTARLVSASSGPYVKTGIIAAGSEDKIKINQVVIGVSGVVGRIIEVSEHTSKILFVNDFNSRIPIITSNSRERGLLVGNNTDLLDILYLKENSKSQVGELILTSGDGEFYPAGLPVGRIESAEETAIKVSTFLDLSKLEFVSILVGDK